METIKQQKQSTPESSSSEAAVKILTFTIVMMSLFIWKKICMRLSHTWDIISVRGNQITQGGDSPSMTSQWVTKSFCETKKKKKKSESLCIYDFFICFTRCWLRSTTPETIHTAWGTNKSNLNFWPDHRDLIWLAKVKPVGMSPVPGVLSWVVTVSAGCLFFFHHPELLVIYPTWIFHTRFLRRLSSPVCSVCWERCPTWLGQDGSSLRQGFDPLREPHGCRTWSPPQTPAMQSIVDPWSLLSAPNALSPHWQESNITYTLLNTVHRAFYTDLGNSQVTPVHITGVYVE